MHRIIAASIFTLAFGMAPVAMAAEAQPAAKAVPATTAAPAGANTSLKIALVDLEKLMRDSKAALSIQKQLETKRVAFDKEFKELDRTLREKEKKLAQSRETAKPEEFSKSRAAFETELMEGNRKVQKSKRALAVAAAEAVAKLKLEIANIVNGLAQKHGYDLVLGRDDVILARQEMDITAQVMSTLDKSVTQIPLKVGAK